MPFLSIFGERCHSGHLSACCQQAATVVWQACSAIYLQVIFRRYTPKSIFISSGALKKQKTQEVNCTHWTLYLAVGFFNDIFINYILGAQTLLAHFWMQSKQWLIPLGEIWKLFTQGIVVKSTVVCHYHRYFGKTTGTFWIKSLNLKASLRNTGEPHQNTYRGRKINLVKHCYEYNFFRSVLSRAALHQLCAGQEKQYNKNISRGSDKNQRWYHKIDSLCYLSPLWLRTNAEILF